MAILDILQYPDDRLRIVAKPVEKVDDETRQIVNDMLETMYHAQGVGLAATQVNIHKRIIVMDVSETSEEPLVLINPTFQALTEELTDLSEGCLSVPGFIELIKRPAKIRLNAVNQKGEDYMIELDNLAAVCVQHEIDHLDGKLFIDYLSLLKRDKIDRKINKQKRHDN